MKPLLDIVGMLEKVIVEHGASAIMRDHLALIKDRLSLVLEEKAFLEKENARLVKDVRYLQEQLKKHLAPENFTLHSGVLFKRDGDRYDESPICPICKLPMSSFTQTTSFSCLRCNHHSRLTAVEIPDVIGYLMK